MKRVIMIGGGPSAFTAAIYASQNGNSVKILERNSTTLKKLLMTGNGKCNYLNEDYSLEHYHSADMERVGKIITEENIQEVHRFFDFLGIIPKIKNGYYYPFSMQASTVKKALEKAAYDCGVEVVSDCLVTKIEKGNSSFSVTTNQGIFECDSLVLASGSMAYPKTGSDGMGYEFLKNMNHTIIKPLPALVQLVGKGSYFKKWDGVRSEAKLTLLEDGKETSHASGEIQLTNYGLSGICTFDLSHDVVRGLDRGKEEVIEINFVPFSHDFSSWLDDYALKHSKKNLQELLEGFLNYKLVFVILEVSSLKGDRFYSDLTNLEKKTLKKNLERFSVPIIGEKGFDYCQICNGGVTLNEISFSTMESLKVKNFYIIGELLDINGNCGGYNLMTCWVSGMLAGKSIGEENASN